MVLALKEIIKALDYDKTSVQEVLSSFEAVDTKSKQEVETFLRNNAYSMEIEKQSATYLIVNDDDFKNGLMTIDGYFTIAIKTLKFAEEISKSTRRKISGKKDEYIPAYLIGQLAKSKTAYARAGVDYLNTAISYIKLVSEVVGGSMIYLDCDDELVGYYEKNKFTYLQKNSESDLNQMYLVI